VGKNYDTLPDYSDIVIEIPDYTYHDSYEKGKVTYQQPAPGVKVKKGTAVHIKVSLGPVPAVKIMEDLVNQKQTIAQNFLTGQGIKYLEYQESSSKIAKGNVTRTEPAAGQELTEGQVVKLYISSGPAVLERDMPSLENQSLETARVILERQELNLVITTVEEISDEVPEGHVIRTEPAADTKIKTGDRIKLYVSKGPNKAKMVNVVGEDIKTAIKILNAAGFTNLRYDEYVNDPAVPEGQVMEQSVAAGEEIAVTTQIVLKLAKGGASGGMPQTKTKKVTFQLDAGTVMTEAYELEVFCQGELIISKQMQALERSVTEDVTGYGVQVYEVRVNGVLDNRIEVDFG
jgi:serine/threonine-protein kinase